MERVVGMDIARGLLALSIAIYHYVQFFDITYLKHFHALINAGLVGVDGFFVISGFALYYVYHKVDFSNIANTQSFFYKRFARIAPLFYLCMLLNIVSEPCKFAIIISVISVGYIAKLYSKKMEIVAFVIISITLLAILFGPGTSSYNRFITLSNMSFIFGFFNPNLTNVRGGWSIGMEYFFYFMFPVLLCFLQDHLRKVFYLFIFTVILAIGYQLLNNTNLYSYNWTEHVKQLNENWPIYTSPLNHFYFFSSGMLLYFITKRFQEFFKPKQRALLATIFVLFLLYCMLGNILGSPSYGFSRYCYSILIIMIIGLTPFICERGSWIEKKLVLLGDISYSVYLIQVPVYDCVAYLTRGYPFLTKFELLFISLLSLLFVSYGCYVLYELPTKKWLINWKSKPTMNISYRSLFKNYQVGS